MNTTDYSTTLVVDKTAEEAFNAINNVRGWWSEGIDGNTENLNDEFTYHYKDVHICKMKLIEVIPNKKIIWLVMDNHFNFTKDKSEWKDTRISFDISERDNKTQILFTHIGLVPEYECFDICQNAWTGYVQNSLRNLITTGKGQPNPIEEVVKEAATQAERINEQDYSENIVVAATPSDVFNAINNVRGWWSEELEGSLQNLDDVFTVRFGEVFITMKVVELIPDEKIVWLVTDCNKPWLKNKKEWNGTKLSWEIVGMDSKTQIRFTHIGLVPLIECFEVCANAWGQYIQQSLERLITTGKGNPTRKK